MDPLTITTIAISIASFLIGHFHVLPFLPAPTPKPPSLPTSIGHGEILKYLEQLIVNAVSQAQPAPVSPANVDINVLLKQLIELIQKQPVAPK